jgi:hypothetical protein
MTPVRFYRLSLLAPLLIPIVLAPFGGAAFFVIVLAFGGLQYFIFAAILYVAIGRLKTEQRIQRLALWSPVLFIPVQGAGWVISGYIEKISNPQIAGIWEALPAFAVYILVIGYACVGVVALAYRVAKTRGTIEAVAL